MVDSYERTDSSPDEPYRASNFDGDVEKAHSENLPSEDATPPNEETTEEYRVGWDENDPTCPLSFSSAKKFFVGFQMALLAFIGSFGSSIISPAETVLAQDFDISEEVTVLAVSLFVLGYAFGPSVWAPVGEVYGRKLSMVPPIFVLGLFSIGSAVSQSAASLFVTRFFGGFFASSAVSNAAASVGDFYGPKDRGIAIAFMAVCVVGGPCLGPIAGSGIIVNPNMCWRWTMWIQAIISFFGSAFALVFLPETYHPVLLKRKAIRLRKETGNEAYWHPQEVEKFQLSNFATKYISRPLRMLTTEPMVTCIAIYASFVYGLLYFQLQAFPIVFLEQRGYSLVISTLPFLGLFIGVLCALAINFANQPRYAKALAKNSGKPVPEARCPPMLVGGLLFSIGMFWFGWTAAPRYNWAIPTVAAGFIGAGFNVTFQQCLNFLADTYGPYAASAMAANTFLRSLLAAGLPLAARPLFGNLGIGPGASLLGGLSCLALPVPVLFMRYGKALRGRSKFVGVQKD